MICDKCLSSRLVSCSVCGLCIDCCAIGTPTAKRPELLEQHAEDVKTGRVPTASHYLGGPRVPQPFDVE